jgi:hypothetical protein
MSLNCEIAVNHVNEFFKICAPCSVINVKSQPPNKDNTFTAEKAYCYCLNNTMKCTFIGKNSERQVLINTTNLTNTITTKDSSNRNKLVLYDAQYNFLSFSPL